MDALAIDLLEEKMVPEETLWTEIKSYLKKIDALEVRSMLLKSWIKKSITPIEEIELYAYYIDTELCLLDEDYASMEMEPLERLKESLKEVDSISKSMESSYSKIGDSKAGRPLDEGAINFFNKFIKKIEQAFSSLPKQLTWQGFYNNDFRKYMNYKPEVIEIGTKLKLNKRKVRALHSLNENNKEEFSRVKETGRIHVEENGEEVEKDILEVGSDKIWVVANKNAGKKKKKKKKKITKEEIYYKEAKEFDKFCQKTMKKIEELLIGFEGFGSFLNTRHYNLVCQSLGTNHFDYYDGFMDRIQQLEFLQMKLETYINGRLAIPFPCRVQKGEEYHEKN